MNHMSNNQNTDIYFQHDRHGHFLKENILNSCLYDSNYIVFLKLMDLIQAYLQVLGVPAPFLEKTH
jgi:hypothetical protein